MARLHYELVGEGPPVLLIAGYGCDLQFWLPISARLSRDFLLLVFDNRGVGRTVDSGEPLTAELMADDAVALARSLGITRAHVVGQSMGGFIAQRIASRNPEFVDRLGLVTSSARLSQVVRRAFRGLLALRASGAAPELVADLTMPWLFGETFLADEAGAEAFKQMALAAPVVQTLEDQARQCRVLELFDGRAELARIKAPTLVVYGREDLVSPEADARLLASIPGATLQELACGHAVTAEAPAQLAEVLARHLLGSPGPG